MLFGPRVEVTALNRSLVLLWLLHGQKHCGHCLRAGWPAAKSVKKNIIDWCSQRLPLRLLRGGWLGGFPRFKRINYRILNNNSWTWYIDFRPSGRQQHSVKVSEVLLLFFSLLDISSQDVLCPSSFRLMAFHSGGRGWWRRVVNFVVQVVSEAFRFWLVGGYLENGCVSSSDNTKNRLYLFLNLMGKWVKGSVWF